MLIFLAEWCDALAAAPTKVAAASILAQSWGSGLSMHVRLAVLVRDTAPVRPISKDRHITTNNDNAMSEAKPPVGAAMASPYLLNCAASQRMLGSGAALLTRP